MCLEALLKIAGDAYITLGRNGKALEKIDILHASSPYANSPSLKLRGISSEALAKEEASGDTLRSGNVFRPDILWRVIMACHPKLWSCSRAKGGGAEGNRTLDLLNAIRKAILTRP